ncbi:MAG: hypothetical protein GF331_27110 [Chitinivibrionales bacterium]|nr:hypothetical protein [Chitinivibrionales bacterium]
MVRDILVACARRRQVRGESSANVRRGLVGRQQACSGALCCTNARRTYPDAMPNGQKVHFTAPVAARLAATMGVGLSLYERIAALMKLHVSAYAVEVEGLFRLIVFNYLVHNGDAHVKNFSLYRDPSLNTYRLTPAYDLLNTRLHLPHESALALDLFDNDYETESYQRNGFFARDDFVEFGARIGIPEQRVVRFLDELTKRAGNIDTLVSRSALPDELKMRYVELVRDRAGAVRYSYS